MCKLRRKYITVIAELKGLQGQTIVESNDETVMVLPQFISAGGGRTLIINTVISKAIAGIARNFWENNQDLKNRIRLKEWSNQTRRLFGAPLSKFDLDIPDEELADSLREQIEKAMEAEALPQSWVLEHVFASTWLSIEDFQSCELGPVKLETRALWLNRMLEMGKIDKVSHRRITNLWAGKKRLKERKPSVEEMAETTVTRSIGNLPFVISVTTNNCLGEAAFQRARRAAHVFLLSSALLWETPSKALSGMNLKSDFGPRLRIGIALRENQMMQASFTAIKHPFGPHINLGEWQTLINDRPELFAALTEIANFVADPKYTCRRRPLLQQVEVALRWFYEGCSSDDDLMAITQFASCLDTLASGGKLSGIKKMIELQVGWTSDTTVHIDGHSLGKFLKRIYGEGRSQFLHGSTEEHFSDWSETRVIAEMVARYCLINCLNNMQKDRSLSSFK